MASTTDGDERVVERRVGDEEPVEHGPRTRRPRSRRRRRRGSRPARSPRRTTVALRARFSARSPRTRGRARGRRVRAATRIGSMRPTGVSVRMATRPSTSSAHVAARGAGVGRRFAHVRVAAHRAHHEIELVGVSAVDRALADAGARGDAFHRERPRGPTSAKSSTAASRIASSAAALRGRPGDRGASPSIGSRSRRTTTGSRGSADSTVSSASSVDRRRPARRSWRAPGSQTNAMTAPTKRDRRRRRTCRRACRR